MLSLLFYFFPGRHVTGVKWRFDRVVDGDTIAFIDPHNPKPIQKISVRIVGIDTPESTHLANSEAEKKHGIAAKNYVYDRVKKARQIHVSVNGWDKYGGRVLGSVKVNGKDLATELIKEGYAVKYDGGKKSDWAKIVKKTKTKKQNWFTRLLKKIF